MGILSAAQSHGGFFAWIDAMMFIAYEVAGAVQRIVFAMKPNGQGAQSWRRQMGASQFAAQGPALTGCSVRGKVVVV